MNPYQIKNKETGEYITNYTDHDEQAEYLLKVAKKIDEEDGAFDNERDNSN